MAQSPLTLNMQTSPRRKTRDVLSGKIGTLIALAIIVCLAAGLRLINIAVVGDGNTYYTAAVKNMLQSPSNFFYGVADAGGVTVDKPPVALWIQAAFAGVLGVSGFVTALPSIIAGTLAVLLLYHLVQKGFGSYAGLIAALALAITPIAVAVDRTNNLDSILIFTLLLATWAFMWATKTGQLRHILLGAVLVGVAFNVKMMQAYLILPALYALYFFGADISWRRKVMQLSAATVVLVVVSISWAVIVDLTPADERPYVGGSESNSVIELAFGYNGLDRVLGADGPGNGRANQPGVQAGRPAGGPPPSGPGGSDEIGEKGITRLFETALANELAWLLPFGLLSIGILAVRTRVTLPLSREHQAMILWGGWLVTGMVFFSVSRFFHAYYLATLAPALAALVGVGAVTLWDMAQEKRGLGLFLTLGFVNVTLIGQLYILSLYDVSFFWFATLIVVDLAVGIAAIALVWDYRRTRTLRPIALALVVVICVTPALWSLETALQANPHAALPAAYASETNDTLDSGGPGQVPVGTTDVLAPAAAYVSDHSGGTTYDLVVASSMVGSSLVLQTDLGVLYLGGFNGQDAIYSAESLAAMAADGMIRFVLDSGDQPGISAWVAATCTEVKGVLPEIVLPGMGGPGQGPPSGQGRLGGLPMLPDMNNLGTANLYDCGSNS